MMNSRLPAMMSRLRAFGQNTAGGVAIMFGGGVFFLMIITAGAIELHRRNQAITELQIAADAAALAGKRKQMELKLTQTAATAQTQGTATAKQMFDTSMARSTSFNSPPPFVDTWHADGSYSVTSSTTFKSMFGTILPPQIHQINTRSTVDVGSGIPTEIALVLDNTASMFNKDGRPNTRFTLMRDASKKFTHQIFDAARLAGQQDMMRVSVIPWATTVNLLGGRPAAGDFSGTPSATVLPDKGSQLPVSNALSRGTLVANIGSGEFKPVQWRGCIQGDTETTAVDDSNPGRFNALRAQAAPAVDVTVSEGPLTTKTVTTCTCTRTEPTACNPGTGTQGFRQQIERAVPRISNANFLFDRTLRDGVSPVEKVQCAVCVDQTCSDTTVQTPDCTTPTKTKTAPYCNYYSDSGRRNSFIPNKMQCFAVYGGCYETGKGPDTVDAEACVADPNEPDIINGRVPWCAAYYAQSSKDWAGMEGSFPPPIAGPNLNCPAPMLGLSGNRAQVVEYLDRMTPVPGGTHADVGLRWGLRSLAATNQWPTFFGLKTPPAAWGDGQKIMVLITDGENESAVDYPGYWGCSRIDTDHPDCKGSPDNAALDEKMQAWCTAIRDKYQTKIFAVAVNFDNTAAVDRLKTCTGSPSNVFSVDAAQIAQVLDLIAARVLALRLTK